MKQGKSNVGGRKKKLQTLVKWEIVRYLCFKLIFSNMQRSKRGVTI